MSDKICVYLHTVLTEELSWWPPVCFHLASDSTINTFLSLYKPTKFLTLTCIATSFTVYLHIRTVSGAGAVIPTSPLFAVSLQILALLLYYFPSRDLMSVLNSNDLKSAGMIADIAFQLRLLHSMTSG